MYFSFTTFSIENDKEKGKKGWQVEKGVSSSSHVPIISTFGFTIFSEKKSDDHELVCLWHYFPPQWCKDHSVGWSLIFRVLKKDREKWENAEFIANDSWQNRVKVQSDLW